MNAMSEFLLQTLIFVFDYILLAGITIVLTRRLGFVGTAKTSLFLFASSFLFSCLLNFTEIVFYQDLPDWVFVYDVTAIAAEALLFLSIILVENNAATHQRKGFYTISRISFIVIVTVVGFFIGKSELDGILPYLGFAMMLVAFSLYNTPRSIRFTYIALKVLYLVYYLPYVFPNFYPDVTSSIFGNTNLFVLYRPLDSIMSLFLCYSMLKYWEDKCLIRNYLA